MTGDGVDLDRVALQEGGRHENLSESRVNAARHVFGNELEEGVYSLWRIYYGGFKWINESEEGLEDLRGFCDLDYGEVGVTLGGLRWLRDREHIMKNFRGGGKDDPVSVEVLELGS